MEGYDENGQFYRIPVGKVWVLRDQYVFGVRQFIDVLVDEYADGTLLQGTEKCQYVLSGDPGAYCAICDVKLVEKGCKHYGKQVVYRCGRKAWFISKKFGHTVCEKHGDE